MPSAKCSMVISITSPDLGCPMELKPTGLRLMSQNSCISVALNPPCADAAPAARPTHATIPSIHPYLVHLPLSLHIMAIPPGDVRCASDCVSPCCSPAPGYLQRGRPRRVLERLGRGVVGDDHEAVDVLVGPPHRPLLRRVHHHPLA